MTGNETVQALSLGALRDEDAPILHAWRSDPDIRDGALAYPFPTSVEAEREWIRVFSPRGTPQDLCLAVRDGNELLGYCQLRSIDWVAGVAEFGIVVGAAHARGKGIGSRALGMTIDYASRQLRLRRLWLRVVETNTAAIRMYESAGFEPEGRLLRHVHRNGRLLDILLYGCELPTSAPPCGA